MQKKVIFIGGTSYSGSTFLDMVLSNDPAGFSCGELASFIYLQKKHQLESICGCGNEDCLVWKNIFNNGNQNLYQKIFSMDEKIQFIVDSSKNPFWIYQQQEKLKQLNIKSYNLLIWKTPSELYRSFHKRRRKDNEWQSKWINYHRRYCTFIDDFKTVKYSELIENPDYLDQLCKYLEIAPSKDKLQYWEKTHHTLFGNKNAKVHLYLGKEHSEKIIKKMHRTYAIKEKDKANFSKPVVYRDMNPGKDDSGHTRIFNNRFYNLLSIILSANDIAKNDQDISKNPNIQKIKYGKINTIAYILYITSKRMYSFFYKKMNRSKIELLK